MSLSRLAEECRKCPFVEKCEHKRMEALGYLPESMIANVIAPSVAELTQPILRETVNTIVDGEVIKVYKDDIEKALYESLYSHLGLSLA